MLKRIAVVGLLGGALLASAARADAVPITGTISLSQTGVCSTGRCTIPVTGNVAALSLGVATGLDFTTTGSLTPNVDGPMNVDSGTGTLAAALTGPGTIKDFCFRPAGGCGAYTAVPVAAWETGPGGGAFDLLTVSIVLQTDAFLNLSGTGRFRVAGFDDTPGIFNFSVTQTGGAFSFSATDAATPTAVPEPASMVLLGMGLLGFVRRSAVGLQSKR